MANNTLKVGYFCMLINLFVLNVIAYSICTIPLCGTKDGSLPLKDNQQIIFKDTDKGVKTVETNAAIVGRYPTSPETGVPIARSFTPDVSKCAEKGQSFCTEDDDYPTDYINFLLQKHKSELAYAFSTDLIANDDDKIEYDVRTNRIRRHIKERFLCDSHEEIIYPTSGKTSDGSILYIINTPTQRQGVSVSKCIRTGQSSYTNEIFPKNVRVECQQQHVYRELLALSPDGVPVKEKFELPAFCKCAIINHKSNEDEHSRKMRI